MQFVIFLLVLSVLVLVHELGHFLAAKWLKVKVEEFALGLPLTKPLVSWKFGETSYAVYPALFGGFVKLFGEEAAVETQPERSFWNRGKKQRLLVIGAGVIMNALLALAIFIALYARIGIPVAKQDRVTIVRVLPESPARLAGLAENDRVLAIEGKSVGNADEFREVIKTWAGLPVNLTIERGGVMPLFEGLVERGKPEQFIATVVPRVNPPAGQGALGVATTDYPYLLTQKCSIYNLQCTIRAGVAGVKAVGSWMGRVIEGLRGIGKSLAAGKSPEGVAGPIGIYQLTGVVAAEGLLPLLELTAILSVNLAVFNVLPIPALDGGRMLFIWLEWLRRGKRLSPELEQKINSWGMAALLGLIALISLQDVFRLGGLAELFGR